jgi:hypothetical protein
LFSRDAFATVELCKSFGSDIIMGVEPDLAKAPYIKDKGKSATSGS